MDLHFVMRGRLAYISSWSPHGRTLLTNRKMSGSSFLKNELGYTHISRLHLTGVLGRNEKEAMGTGQMPVS